jgi:hypothetical protein
MVEPVFISIYFPRLAHCRNLYVDQVNGNSQNDGFSRQTPLETIQSAHDRTAPGDRVIVLSGCYQERVRITRPGRSGQPIRLAEGVFIFGPPTVIPLI